MDAAAFWQENKRWLGCIGVGLVVWFVGSKIVGSLADPARVNAGTLRLLNSENNQEQYDAAARDAARKEGELLGAELKKLQAELSFDPDPKFDPANKGMTADDYLTTVGSNLKRTLVQRCNRLGVDISDKKLTWPQTGVPEEIRAVLAGLNLIEVASARLLEAHEQVRKNNPDAMGLRSIDSFSMEGRSARSSLPKATRPGEVDLSERLSQQRIAFQFQSDTATALLFFDALRQPRKTLVVEEMSVNGGKPGEPVTVKGKLLGVVFKEGV